MSAHSTSSLAVPRARTPGSRSPSPRPAVNFSRRLPPTTTAPEASFAHWQFPVAASSCGEAGQPPPVPEVQRAVLRPLLLEGKATLARSPSTDRLVHLQQKQAQLATNASSSSREYEHWNLEREMLDAHQALGDRALPVLPFPLVAVSAVGPHDVPAITVRSPQRRPSTSSKQPSSYARSRPYARPSSFFFQPNPDLPLSTSAATGKRMSAIALSADRRRHTAHPLAGFRRPVPPGSGKGERNAEGPKGGGRRRRTVNGVLRKIAREKAKGADLDPVSDKPSPTAVDSHFIMATSGASDSRMMRKPSLKRPSTRRTLHQRLLDASAALKLHRRGTAAQGKGDGKEKKRVRSVDNADADEQERREAVGVAI